MADFFGGLVDNRYFCQSRNFIRILIKSQKKILYNLLEEFNEKNLYKFYIFPVNRNSLSLLILNT